MIGSKGNGIGPEGPDGPMERTDDSVPPARDSVPSPAASEVSIILIDDHAILREGLCALLELETDLRVVGQADSISTGIAQAQATCPDVIITDLSLPGTSDLRGLRELRRHFPSMRLLVLTVHDTEEYIRAALAAGADGYMVKDATRAELIYGLRAVLRGQRHLCSRSSVRVMRNFLGASRPKVPTIAGVTEREREVLLMIARGLSNKRIAASLRRSVKTVEKHRANLMRKLKLHNVAEVTRFALETGLLPGDQSDETIGPPPKS